MPSRLRPLSRWGGCGHARHSASFGANDRRNSRRHPRSGCTFIPENVALGTAAALAHTQRYPHRGQALSPGGRAPGGTSNVPTAPEPAAFFGATSACRHRNESPYDGRRERPFAAIRCNAHPIDSRTRSSKRGQRIKSIRSESSPYISLSRARTGKMTRLRPEMLDERVNSPHRAEGPPPDLDVLLATFCLHTIQRAAT